MATQIIEHDHQRVGDWLHQHGLGPQTPAATCIGLERDGALVAGVRYENFNGASICAHIVIAGPITRTFLWFIFAYPYLQLKCNVIIGLIAADNLNSQRLVERMGFTLAADLPHAHPCGLLGIWTLHRDDCRFIRGAYGRLRETIPTTRPELYATR